MRHCEACDTKKPLTEFTVSSRHVDGIFPICKVCKNKIKREQEKKMKQKDKESVPVAKTYERPPEYVPAKHNPAGYQRETDNAKYKSKGDR